MGIDLNRLTSPENTEKFRRYHFLSEHYHPSLVLLRDNARGHLVIAQSDGICVEEAQYFFEMARQLEAEVLYELTELHTQLYPGQSGLVRND